MKKYLLPTFCALLAGCTQSELVTPQDNAQPEIQLYTVVNSVQADTRGMLNSNSISLANPLNAMFALVDNTNTIPADANYPAVYDQAENISFTASSTQTSFINKKHYRSDGNPTKLIGWHPATGTFTRASSMVDFAAIDGETDIISTQLIEGTKSTPVGSAEFQHHLTQISVKIYTLSNPEKLKWGKIESITIKNKKQTCRLTLPATTSPASATARPTATFSGTDNLPLVRKNPADNSAITYPAGGLELPVANDETGALLAGYAMFAPNAIGIILEMDIKTELAGTKTASINQELKAGYMHQIALKFGAAEITPIIEIKNWDTGGNIPVDM